MYEGIIVFRLVNVGSKSEGLRPFIYKGMGSFLEVWKEDDCSLCGDSLIPFDGKSVVVEGYDDDSGIFVIESITEKLPNNIENVIEVSNEAEERSEELLNNTALIEDNKVGQGIADNNP